MNEKTRQKIIFATIPLALLWAAFNFESDKKEISTQPGVQVSAEAQAALTGMNKPAKQLYFDTTRLVQKSWGADPFRVKQPTINRSKPTSRRVYEPGFELSGIMYNSNAPVAIINKSTVRVGDKIDGAKVTEITRSKVIIEYKGKVKTLTVSKG